MKSRANICEQEQDSWNNTEMWESEVKEVQLEQGLSNKLL